MATTSPRRRISQQARLLELQQVRERQGAEAALRYSRIVRAAGLIGLARNRCADGVTRAALDGALVALYQAEDRTKGQI